MTDDSESLDFHLPGRREPAIDEFRLSARAGEDVKAGAACALGLAVHARLAYETRGRRLDRLTQAMRREARLERLERAE